MDTKEFPKIIKLVKGQARFKCYRDGDLWYEVYESGYRDPIFEFPIPIKDTGTGIFDATMKAITLMRWIRIHRDKVLKGEA